MHEVELDSKPIRHGDIPRCFGITGVGIWKVGGLNLPKHVGQLNGVCLDETEGAEGPDPKIPAGTK